MWETTDTLTTSSLNLAAVSCPGTTICYAVGETSLQTGMVLSSLDGGHTWHQLTMPNGVPPLSGIACPSMASCLAVGESTVMSTTNEGLTWTSSTVGPGRFAAIACPSAQVCIAASVITPGGSQCQSGRSLATQNAGATWNTTQLGCFVPSGISCPAVNICDMVGTATSGGQVGSIMMTRNSGRSWTAQFTAADQSSGLGGIWCSSVQTCVAAGWGKDALVRTVSGGSTWQPQSEQYPLGPERFYAVTCLSATNCLAVGSAQPERMSQAGAWLVLPAPTDVRVLTGVACPSASDCVAVGITDLGSGVTLSLVS